jgi:tRNA 5-methylaminomethyl-2-thiouridine biosynthesis bifunctional protein
LQAELSAPKISVDEQGHPCSTEYGDIYASRDGAVSQARYVFLAGNGLPGRWQGREQFVILENGFGLGTNFLTTLKAWREDPLRSERLFFVSVERHPVSKDTLTLYADKEIRGEAQELSEKWPDAVPGVHEVVFDGGRVRLLLYFMSADTAAKRLSLGFDALYLDGFSPRTNPEMWNKALLKRLSQYARPEATLATWCVAGAVRQSLEEAGFTVEKKRGFGHKAFMTVGRYEPKFKVRRSAPPALPRPAGAPKKAIIIGAGLAGCAVSRELSHRGWELTVIDAGRVPASEASAIRYGMLHVQAASDDNLLYRLTRAGAAFAEGALAGCESFYRAEGLFQMAKDAQELEKWQKNFSEGRPFAVPASYMEVISCEEASHRLGARVSRGGIWHYHGGLVNAGPWARYELAESGAAVIGNTRVGRLEFIAEEWHAFDENGVLIAKAPVAVVAAASDSGRLLGLKNSVRNWRGRVSLLSEEDIPFLKGGITGRGYAIRSEDGWICAGASYEEEDSRPLDALEVHEANLRKLADFFPDLKSARAEGFFDGLRAVSRDRLPIVGSLSDLKGADAEGLYCAFAFASRAITLCSLSARIIAARIEGEPLPVESDLARALSPVRLLEGK